MQLIFLSHIFLFLFSLSLNAAFNNREENNLNLALPEKNLHEAIERNDIETVNILLAAGANIETKDTYGNTPLHSAAFRNNTEIVEILLNKGAEIDARNKENLTPLLFVIQWLFDKPKETQELFLKTINLLIHRKTNLKAMDNSGYTPLHLASFYGFSGIVSALLDAGANLETQNFSGNTPLHEAVIENHKDTVEILLHKGAEINARNYFSLTPLGNLFLKVLDQKKEEPFLDMIAFLIEKKADKELPNPQNQTLLYLASCFGFSGIVKLLVDAGANLEAKDWVGTAPLHRAVAQNNKEVVEILLHKGAQVDTKNNSALTPLWTVFVQAVSAKKEEPFLDMTALLINKKADKDLPNPHGQTLLHLASGYGFLEIAKLLADAGANLRARDRNGQRPLDTALACGFAEIANILRDAEKKAHESENLFAACASNNYGEVERILKINAALRLSKDALQKALDSAVEQGSTKTMELFMEHAPEAFHFSPQDGYKHLYLAAKKDHINTVKYLLNHNHLINTTLLNEITNTKIKDLIYFYQNKHNIDIKNTFFTIMTTKILNLDNKNEPIPVRITFEKVLQHEELYIAKFSFIYGKAPQSKSIVIKPQYADDNPYKIELFNFYKHTPQGYKQEKSISYINDILFVKNKKTGKLQRDNNKVLFTQNFPVKYSEDLRSISITMNTDNTSFSKTITLSNSPNEDVSPSTKTLPRPFNKEVQENTPLATDTKTRPSRSNFIGTYEGTSNYQPVAHAEIGDNGLWLMFSNNEIHEFTTTINENDKVTSLQGITNFGKWNFAQKCDVYLEGDTLVLECAEAKNANKKQPFVFRLRKTTKARPIIISVETRATHPQVRHPIIAPAAKQPKIAAEPEMPILSKNQRKKQERKRKKQQAQENLAEQQQNLMPDVPEARSARTLPPVNLVNEQDVIKNSPPQSHQTMAQVKNPPSLGEKDFDELLDKNKPAIKLEPTPHRECPLFQQGILWEGVATSFGHEELSDKKLLFSLTNLQNRKGVWGSLWASALGKEDNYSNGKNIHWSYHKQDNGDEYLYISHHYLFKIIKSCQDNGYTLELVKNKDTNRLNDVKSYKVHPKNIDDINPSYAMEHFGINHDEVHEEELLNSYNETYERILIYLGEQKYELSADFDLYFISEKTWELLDILNGKKQIIKTSKDAITIENKKKKHR